MNIDDELKIALRREEPPAGFAERVLARLPETRSNVVPMRPRRTSVLLSGIAAAALLGAFGSLAFVLPRREAPATGQVSAPKEMSATAPVAAPPPAAPAPKKGPAPGTTAVVVPVKYSPPKPRVRPAVVDEEGQRAAEKLMLALQITGSKLSTVKKTVRENLVERRSL